MDEHVEALQNLCRLCGENIMRYRVHYSCQTNAEKLYKAFFKLRKIAAIFTPQICAIANSCYAIMNRKINAIENEKHFFFTC